MVTNTAETIEPRILAGILRVAKALDDPEWAELAIAKEKKNHEQMPELKPLEDRLLSLGGDWVALEPECDLMAILNRGRIFKGRIIFKKWRRMTATETVVRYGQKDRESTKLRQVGL